MSKLTNVSEPAPLSTQLREILLAHAGITSPQKTLSKAEHAILITACSQLNDAARELSAMIVDDARTSGMSWTDIGTAMGVSKQNAHQMFRRPAGAVTRKKHGSLSAHINHNHQADNQPA